MKNSVTEHDRATVTEEQDRRAPSAPAAHELTPAQLELVVGGTVYCSTGPRAAQHPCFVKR
jgi:hypothetical protein